MAERQLSTGLRALIERESNKQLIKFVFIGGFAVLTDLACYYLFLQLFPEGAGFGWLQNEMIAKSLSFLCGLSVTYQFNKRWTWRRKDKNNRRLLNFMLLYGVSLLLNVGLNSNFLTTLHARPMFAEVPNKYLIAFVGATGICAAFTFLGQKFWIFRSPE